MVKNSKIDVLEGSNDKIIQFDQELESFELLSSHQEISDNHDEIEHITKKLKPNSKVSDVDNCFKEYF